MSNNKIKLPSHVKQIGNVNNDMMVKIYIEDYAYNYLKQYVKKGNYSEKLAFLVGKSFIEEDNKNIILISGVIKARNFKYSEEILDLSEKTWEEIYKQRDRYFNDLEIIGLMLTKAGNNKDLGKKYMLEFKNGFSKVNSVFLLYDVIEDENIFYVLDKERENLIEVESYFVYYEKNNEMSEYMLESKERDNVINKDKELEIEKDSFEIDLARRKQFDRVQKRNDEQKKVMNMLISLSVILFLICFIMGAGLIKNEERICKLEERLKNFNRYCKSFEERDDSQEVFFDREKIKKNDGEEKFIEIEEKDKKDDNLVESGKKDKDENICEDNGNNEEEGKNNLKSYIVKEGDNLSLISRKFFGDIKMVKKILEINNMADADKIYVGKVLKIPEGN